MQLVRAMASYYRQSHPDLLRDNKVPLGGQTRFAVFVQARRRWGTASAAASPGCRDGKGASAKGPPPPPPAPKNHSFFAWTRWALGSVAAVLLSLWSSRWQKLLLIGGEVENAVKVVETAAEVVEEVAAAAEKVSAEVAEKLPADGKLRRAALAVEKASTEVVAGAETVEDIIHKVDELEQEVKAFLKPVIDQTKDHK